MTISRTAPITIIVPTYNRAELLGECLQSLVSQTVRAQQIIVVDDGSTDHTEERIQPFRHEIEYIYQANSGKPAAMNAALRHATQPLIWIFDDDDVALPTFIEEHWTVFESDESVDYTYSNFFFAKTDHFGTLEALRPNEFFAVENDEIFLRLLIGCFFKHTAMVVKKKCYVDIGGFDEGQLRSEDYDIQIRLAARFVGHGLDRPLMLFRLHDGARGSAASRHNASERDRVHLEYDRRCIAKALADPDFGAVLPVPFRSACGIRLVQIASATRVGLNPEDTDTIKEPIKQHTLEMTPLHAFVIRSTLNCPIALRANRYPLSTFFGIRKFLQHCAYPGAGALYAEGLKYAAANELRQANLFFLVKAAIGYIFIRF